MGVAARTVEVGTAEDGMAVVTIGMVVGDIAPYWGPSFGLGYYDYPDYYGYDDYRVYRGVPRYATTGNLVFDVQRSLKRRGYYRGTVDGQAGPGTRAAIRTYQADRGFSVTGRIDGRLVRSLGLD